MKRYALPLLLLGVLAMGASQLRHLAAQTAPVPPPAPPAEGAGAEVPAMPAPPPPVAQNGAMPGAGYYGQHMPPHSGGAMVPGMPNMPGMPGMPGMAGMPNMPNMPGMPGMPPMARPPRPHVSRPADPRVVELTNRYNELEQQVMQMAHEFRQSELDSQTREKLQQQITKITAQQFQLRHEVRQIEMERLQQQLGELQKQLQQRAERRAEIIERRVAQLTNQGDELRWEPLLPPGANAPSWHAGSESGTVMPGSWVPAPFGQRHGEGGGYFDPSTFDPYTVGPATAAPPHMPGMPPSPPPQPERHAPERVNAPSVTEAEARLAIAERDLGRVQALFESGTVPTGERDRAEDAVRLSRILLEQTLEEQKLRVQMLELDVRKEEAELQAAHAELEAIKQLAGQQQDTEVAAQVRRLTAQVQQKELEVQRARLMFERQMQRAKPDETDPAEKSAR